MYFNSAGDERLNFTYDDVYTSFRVLAADIQHSRQNQWTGLYLYVYVVEGGNRTPAGTWMISRQDTGFLGGGSNTKMTVDRGTDSSFPNKNAVLQGIEMLPTSS